MAAKKAQIFDRDIQALVDNELEPDIARAVKKAVMQCPFRLKRYEHLLKQKRMLQQWWQYCHHEN